jgi:S1-C subfamily serine protease
MENIEKSIVQIISEHYELSYSYPWNFVGKFSSTGSGFCLLWEGKKYIITNAHCVHNANNIKLRKRGHSEQFHAQLLWIVYECDLAVLTVLNSKKKEMADFWDDIPPLKLGKMPDKLSEVYVYGYPLGGFNISATKGVVSRIQIVRYFGVLSGIAVQVDAAINFGNSGGPAVDKSGDIVGVAFAGEDDSITQNMGYLIPPVIIEYFLQSIPDVLNKSPDKSETLRFPGLCSLEITTQSLHNEVLRDYIKIPKDKSGILITGVSKINISSKYLKKDDVLLAIDGRNINNDGTILLSDIISIYGDPNTSLGMGEIIPYHNYIHFKNPGQNIELSIWRKGKEKNVKFTIEPHYFAIPRFEYQATLSYYIIMGMVFIPVSFPLIKEKERNREYVHHLHEIAKFHRNFKKDKQVIILSDIFTSRFTEEFPLGNYIIESINKSKVKNMCNFAELIKKFLESSEYITFEFKQRESVIILKSSDVMKYDRSILEENLGKGIPNFRI